MATAAERIDGLTSLPALDPVKAETTNRLIALLNGEWIEDEHHKMLVTEASSLPPPTNPWFDTALGIKIHIASTNGARAVYAHDRLDDIVAALDAVDPLLSVVERCIGLSLEPIGLVDAIADEDIQLSVALYMNKAACETIDVAIPLSSLNADFLAAAKPVGTPILGDTPCVANMIVRAADLSIDEAAALDIGDLILLGLRSPGRLEWSGGASDGAFDFGTSVFSAGPNSGDDMNDDPGRSDGGFSVPISIRLPSRTLSMETLAGLKPGATLPLGPITNGLGVEILVGGRALAKGELVQVGAQFAVLVESRLGMQDETTGAGAEE